MVNNKNRADQVTERKHLQGGTEISLIKGKPPGCCLGVNRLKSAVQARQGKDECNDGCGDHGGT